MTADSKMPKPLPPGFPLPPVGKAGRAIRVGAQVRIVSVRSCANALPIEDQKRLRSYEGQTLSVLEIDRYGMLWFGFDGSSPDFSLRPEEVAVV
jgi:hypothetical protein